MSFDDEAARLMAISDPAARARAAAEASRDVSAMLRAIEVAAIAALVDAHGGARKYGSFAAAGRELGRSAEAVRKRLLGDGAADESAPYEQEGEPARYFDSAEEAHDALRDWHIHNAHHLAHRDPLVRGALAAGLAPRVVRDTTGLSLDTIDRLESTSAGTAVEVPDRVWEETVYHLASLAPDLGCYGTLARGAARDLAGVIGLPVDQAGRQPAIPEALHGPGFEALSPQEKAERIMSTELPGGVEVPLADAQDVLSGPDGWAAAFCAEAEAAAGGQDAELAAATRRVAAVIRHVRVTAALPADEGTARA
ncbi:hypothetical protein [Streptomyces anulatus]|uniref:hypothetical protein n=1 Tax=Streptomyces anulatus TaxID=1892 RepID=UPI001C2613A4|nr:hypothetical protein [Streptomyces anulatus]